MFATNSIAGDTYTLFPCSIKHQRTKVVASRSPEALIDRTAWQAACASSVTFSSCHAVLPCPAAHRNGARRGLRLVFQKMDPDRMNWIQNCKLVAVVCMHASGRSVEEILPTPPGV